LSRYNVIGALHPPRALALALALTYCTISCVAAAARRVGASTSSRALQRSRVVAARSWTLLRWAGSTSCASAMLPCGHAAMLSGWRLADLREGSLTTPQLTLWQEDKGTTSVQRLMHRHICVCVPSRLGINVCALHPSSSCRDLSTVICHSSLLAQCPSASSSSRKRSHDFLVTIPLYTPLASTPSSCLAPSLTNSCCTSSSGDWIWTVIGAWDDQQLLPLPPSNAE
jgi:hypothetical protein